MEIDFEKAKQYLKEIESIEAKLSSHEELYDNEKFIEFKQITNALKQNIEIAKSESRKLSIGIIGAVKAGKSSFLNACIFDGEEYLPKAATPMTAALTKISYSDTPKAIIHFYTSEDWEMIEENSAKYDENLKKDYNEYVEKIKEKNLHRTHAGGALISTTKAKSIDNYEKELYKCKSENQHGAKELTRMVTDLTLLDKLGKIEVVEGDILSKLDNYVGVDGYYTPIVSYVELQVDIPYMKDFEIVDTPGLNDPIVSRGICTKQFLRNCDVVLLLSPCSQFMDANTVRLMANSLPEAGVKEILIVGSKIDSGVLNETRSTFEEAYKNSLDSYKSQFLKNLTEAKKEGRHLDILNKMSSEKVLYVSSICFTIDKKIKSTKKLDENEKKVYENLHNYKDFEDKYLASLSGIKKVQKALNEVINKKVEIIDGKNITLLENTRDSHLKILEKILQETVSSRMKLETISADELKDRNLKIKDTIDSVRNKLMYIFESAAIKCEEKIQWILPQLTMEAGLHQKNYIETKQEDRTRIEKTGLFGWTREKINYTVTNDKVGTDSVIKNIKEYSAKCKIYINSEFKYIFNKEEFSQKIKEIILSAFQKSQKDFNEDDILLPLHNILLKISIPYVDIDSTKYIDEVNTRFPNACAQNEEINKLITLQSILLNKIEKEISILLVEILEEIKEVLNKQAVTFADQVEKDLCTEIEKLKEQIEEREYYIKEYQNFTEIIKEMKLKLLI